jgi:pimeloyl-ACP methyl ester carboxylesterase
MRDSSRILQEVTGPNVGGRMWRQWALRSSALEVVLLIALAGVLLLTGAWLVERYREWRDRRRYAPPGELLELGARRLHYASRGGAPGPTVVIEPGAGCPASLWWSVQARIANFSRVISYDRAGYLWSDPGRGERTLTERVQDLKALLARADAAPPYVFLAHGMGGLIARLFAREHPTLVAGLVLIETPPETVLLRRSFQLRCQRRARRLRLQALAAGLGLVRLWAALGGGRELPGERAGRALCVRPRHSQAVRADLLALTRWAEALRQPGTRGALGERPLVVISHAPPAERAAASESAWQEGQRQLAALSSDSELVLAARRDLAIALEEPELVVEAVRRVHAAVRQGSRLTGVRAAVAERSVR